MPHRPGHGRSGTDNTEADRINKQRASIQARKDAAEDFRKAGIMSLGGGTDEQRRAISAQTDPRYGTPPGGGGRLTVTKPSGETTETVFTGDDDDKGVTTVTDTGEELRTFDVASQQLLIKNNIPFLTKVLGATARVDANGNIIFVDKTGSTIPQFKVLDALSGTLDKFTGFNPEKAFTSKMGETGKAALFDMISNMDQVEFEDFINRKGNLDRILDFAGDLPQPQNQKILDLVKNKDAKGFADLIADTAGDKDKFNAELLKKTNPQRYYEANPPTTDLERREARLAGVTFIPGYGPLTFDSFQGDSGFGVPNPQQQQFAGALPPPPPSGSGTTPPPNPGDLIFRTMYRPGFTPSYTGGPEQIQLAGGFFDPRTQQVVYDPYGTASQYRFSKGGIANFQNYGY
tara:strand:+ start:7226 stop:8434 length:1209 start_codon:yes stop_codon:yes gene_type:complete